MNIVVYTKANCPNCEYAKNLLKSKALEYAELHQEADDIEFNLMFKMHPEARQMPQIFIEGQRVGGLAGLQQALKELGI